LTDQRAALLELYAAAIDAAQPGPAVTAALAGAALQRRVHVIAIGKAAPPMAAAAVSWVVTSRRELAGGVVVTADTATPDPAIGNLPLLVGDHPLPGARSVRAAAAIAAAAAMPRMVADAMPPPPHAVTRPWRSGANGPYAYVKSA
jgi:glycerate-2-kinase